MGNVSVKAAVSVEEYLNTAYEFPPEYVDGELLERTLPNIAHSRAQNRIGALLENASAARLFAAPQLRLKVTATRFRMPDVVVFADFVPDENYPSKPPFGVIEVLSPDDSQDEMIDQMDDYSNLGVPYIWVVDPNHRRIYRYDHGSLLQQEALSVPERGLRLEPSAIFG